MSGMDDYWNKAAAAGILTAVVFSGGQATVLRDYHGTRIVSQELADIIAWFPSGARGEMVRHDITISSSAAATMITL